MNLHGLASGVTRSVNPMMACQWSKNTGATTAIGGKRTPTYATPVTISAQVQQLTAADIKHMNNQNIASITRKVWSSTILTATDREAGVGGDLLTLPDGTTWLVVQLMEVWSDWCSALIQKQVA